MRKILILGASGFIGKKVADDLSQNKNLEVIRYSRRPGEGFFSCEFGAPAWQKMVSNCEAIINCSGVGLAKIKQQKNANESIARELVSSLPLVNTRCRLLHLSTIKAFNINNYQDAYSADKRRAEGVLIEHGDRLCGELLRIPAVFGPDDENLMPLLNMAKKGRLPEVQGEVCRWHCISTEDVSHYIQGWLDKEQEQTLSISYLLSKKRYDVNDLIRAINRYVHGRTYQASKKKLFYIKVLYKILAIQSIIFSGFGWNRYPPERFHDLFNRNWEVEAADHISLHFVDFEPADLWK